MAHLLEAPDNRFQAARPDPAFSRGDVLVWKTLRETFVVINDPRWEDRWNTYSYNLGGTVNILEEELERA
jgi:hypothetical protein